MCSYRIVSAVLGEAKDVNRGLLREKVTIIWLKMKMTCFGVTLGRWISWGEKSGHEKRHWKWNKDFWIFRRVRLCNSLPVEAVETKLEFQKWIVQCMWLNLTQENPWPFCCRHCQMPHSDCSENEMPSVEFQA